MKAVAILPARGGSKGIPKKNLMPFCGKPLIAWSIEQAKEATSISSVWVSSDSDEILDAARSYGARTIKRPDDISGDTATSEAVWLHGIKHIREQGETVDLVIGMQPTSPLREPQDLDRGVADFVAQNCDSLFSCAVLEDFYIWSRDRQGQLQSVNYDYLNRKRRQDMAEQYVENGSFYVFTPRLIEECGNRLGKRIGVSKMEFWKSFEIDSLEGAKFCEMLMQHHLLNRKART
jgi:CMP-N,N'-diacetyllegionaminic acid synthase